MNTSNWKEASQKRAPNANGYVAKGDRYSFKLFWLMKLAAVVSLLTGALLAGCTTRTVKNGVERHYIVGFGIVSVHQPHHSDLIVTSTEALGLSITDRPGWTLGLGYSTSLTTTVNPAATELLTEVRFEEGQLQLNIPYCSTSGADGAADSSISPGRKQ